MLHYRPFFAGQSFLEHDLEKVTNLTVALANINVEASVFHCRLDYMHCARPRHLGFYSATVLSRSHCSLAVLPCIGELMNMLTTGAFTGSNSLQQEGVPQGAPAWDGCTSRIPVSGFLLHHFDAWVNPHLLRDMDRRLIWLNENGIWGLTDFCGQGAELENDTAWHWGYTAKREGIVSVQEAMNHGLLKKWPPGRMCRGHADIYYVPTRFMPTFASVAPYFYNSFHEAGVPTLLHISMAEADLDEKGKGVTCTHVRTPARTNHLRRVLSAALRWELLHTNRGGSRALHLRSSNEPQSSGVSL